MKKIIALFLSVLLLAATAVTVLADSVPKLTIRAGNTEPRIGETVKFSVSVNTIENCRSGGIVLSYDTGVFEFVSGQCLVGGAVMSDFTGGTGVFAFGEGHTVSGSVFSFTLRVKDTAAYGNYTVSCKTNFRNDSGSVALQVSGAGIALNCAHTYESWVNADASAHQRACSKCGKEEMSSHTWDSGRITSQPSCKDEGQALLTCTACGTTKTQTLAKTDSHTYGGCEKVDDSTHKRSCAVCGKENTAAHTWNSGKVTKQPNCKENGIKTYTCTGCGATREEALAKTGDHSYGAYVKVDDSNHKQTCTVCGKESAASHTWNSGKVTKQPNCKESGIKTYTCTGCGVTKRETMAKTTNHTYDHDCDTACNVCGLTRETAHKYPSGWCSDKNAHWHACSVCGEKKDTAAHIPGKEATETTPQRCTVCGYVVKAALGHKHSFAAELSYDENGHWYPCSGCNEQEIAGHNFENGCDTLCETCGYVREISHAYDEGWCEDAAGHWQVCGICGEKTASSEHIPGEEATEEKAQTCMVCARELTPKLERVSDGEEETAHRDTEPDSNDAEMENSQIGFPWWVMILGLGLAAAGAGFVVLWKRRK